MNDVSTILDLAFTHQWVAFSAAIIFLLVRLLKMNATPWPLSTIPPKARTLVVVLLGFAGAGLQSVLLGISWERALAENVAAALIAILSHDVFIEWARGGRELFETKWPTEAPTKKEGR